MYIHINTQYSTQLHSLPHYRYTYCITPGLNILALHSLYAPVLFSRPGVNYPSVLYVRELNTRTAVYCANECALVCCVYKDAKQT